MKFTKVVKAEAEFNSNIKQDLSDRILDLINSLYGLKREVFESKSDSIHYEYILDHIEDMISQIDIDVNLRLKHK